MPQPYTMQFGPWVPDGSDASFQPAQNTAFEVPVADCLNVYWVNGAYQSLPTLTALGALPAACLGAYTALDSSGSPQIYAGTATDLYRWNGSSWVSVSKSAGAYAGTTQWSFAVLGGCLLAQNGVTLMQDAAIGGATFADVPAAPIGNVIGVINQFLMVGDLTVGPFPYRVQWSAIGDPTNYPTPLTDAAIAAQSSNEDLNQDFGPVMFIAGGPQFGVIFQRLGITRASYVGGDVVFQFAPYDRKRGLIARGAAVQMGDSIYYISDDGFHATDGSQIVNIGRSADNEMGLDQWFWANVNTAALSAIRSGYDATKQCVVFAIPTGSNTKPDTLLIFNPTAKRWTRATQPCEVVFTSNDGTRHQLGLFNQSHSYGLLTGAPLTGYLESYDVGFTDAHVRYVTGVRPNVVSVAAPTVRIGTRKAMGDAITYTGDVLQDAFSRIAPFLVEAAFFRVRVSSSNASVLHGATAMVQNGGPV